MSNASFIEFHMLFGICNIQAEVLTFRDNLFTPVVVNLQTATKG